MIFPTLDELRARGTRKWTVYSDDVLPLWIAESDFPTCPEVKAAIAEAVEAEAFGYTPARSDLDAAVSDFYATRFGWRPPAVRWIGDVVRGMLIGVQHFTRPGSAVIVPTPSYPPLLEIPQVAGREKVETSLELEEIETAFRAGAGSILLANPYNPLGLVLSEDYLRALADMARRYGARILSDEIHAPIVLEGTHVPVARIAPDVAYTVTATSKAWNTAGLKCAQVLLSNDEDVRVWDGLDGVTKDGTGTLGVIAAAAAYRLGVPHLEQQLEILRTNRDLIARQLEAVGIRCTRPAATYLMWLDFSDTPLAGNPTPAAWLRKNAKVALNEGTAFAAPGHARLNFATSPEILTAAGTRISDSLKI